MSEVSEFTQVRTEELDKMISQLRQYKNDENGLRKAVNILETDFGLVTTIKNMEGKSTASIILNDLPRLIKRMTRNKESNAFSILGQVLSKYANK